jgi:hypothetical protein
MSKPQTLFCKDPMSVCGPALDWVAGTWGQKHSGRHSSPHLFLPENPALVSTSSLERRAASTDLADVNQVWRKLLREEQPEA